MHLFNDCKLGIPVMRYRHLDKDLTKFVKIVCCNDNKKERGKVLFHFINISIRNVLLVDHCD